MKNNITKFVISDHYTNELEIFLREDKGNFIIFDCFAVPVEEFDDYIKLLQDIKEKLCLNIKVPTNESKNQ